MLVFDLASSIKWVTGVLPLGPWWWSNGQRACLLLRRAEVESRCNLCSFSAKWRLKRTRINKKRPGLAQLKNSASPSSDTSPLLWNFFSSFLRKESLHHFSFDSKLLLTLFLSSDRLKISTKAALSPNIENCYAEFCSVLEFTESFLWFN